MASFMIIYCYRQQSGSGLLELIVASLIIAILAAISLPDYRRMMDSYRLIATVGEFKSMISLARNEAVRRGVRVDVIPVDGVHWNRGWLVLIDANNNQKSDTNDIVLHTRRVTVENLQVTASLRDSKKSYLAFAPSGCPRSANNSAAPQIGSFVFSAGQEKRKVVMSFLGRVRSCDPDRDGAAC